MSTTSTTTVKTENSIGQVQFLTITAPNQFLINSQFITKKIAENNAMLILWSAYCIIYSPNPPPYSIPCSPR